MQPTAETATPAMPEAPAPQPPAPAAPVRSRRISLGQQIHPPPGELLTLQRLEKAIHPVVSAIRDGKTI